MIKEFESEIKENKQLTPDTVHLVLSVPDKIEFKAGQYVLIGIPIEHPGLKGKDVKGAEGTKVRRAYSIVNCPSEDDRIELCIKDVEGGTMSGILCELKEGDKVSVMGPLGNFLVRNTEKDIVFVAVGAGIAPFVNMIKYLLEKNFPNNIILIKGARREEDMMYDDLFNNLQDKHDNFKFHNVLSRPQEGFENKGYVQDFIEKFVENIDSDYYICGLEAMIEGVKEKLKSNGVEVDHIFYEKYD
jgi:Na+-transporting NADH:ubiquinone oxidoreductase subunit F